MSDLNFFPERWLVCSASAESNIREGWGASADAASLTALRLRSGQVERVELTDVGKRVNDLSQQGCGRLHIVFEHMGAEEINQYRLLRAIEADMRLHVWREAPQEVMRSLGTPEEPVLRAWQAARSMPSDIAAAGDRPASWQRDYVAALEHWAAVARVELPEEMAQRYDPVPEVTSIRALLAAFGRAAAATVTSGTAATVDGATAAGASMVRVVRMVAGTDAHPDLAGAHHARDHSGPVAPPVRVWPIGEGISLSVPLPGYSDEADLQLVSQATAEQARAIGSAVVRIGSLPPIDFGDDTGTLHWYDNGRGSAVAVCEVPYTKELAAAIADTATSVEVLFTNRDD